MLSWLAEPEGTGRIRLQVLFREYDPAVGARLAAEHHHNGSEVSYGESRFTVESTLRRYLDAEAQVAVQALATRNDERKMKLFNELVRRHDESKAGAFKGSFGPAATPDADYGGMVMLEPYSAPPADPPLAVSGCVFPSQGDRGTKRVWMLAETDDGGVAPVRIRTAFDTADAAGPRRRRKRARVRAPALRVTPGLEPPSPFGDLRMLAGSVVVGSPDAFVILSGLANMLTDPVVIASVNGPGGAIVTAPVPTLLTVDTLHQILGRVRSANSQTRTPAALIPLLGDRAVDIISAEIDRNRGRVTSHLALQPLVDLVGNEYRRIHNAPGLAQAERRDLLKLMQELTAAVRRLQTDPILFLMGPALSTRQASEIDPQGMPGVRIHGVSPDRRTVLPGFAAEVLGYFGEGLPTNAAGLYAGGLRFTDAPAAAGVAATAFESSVNTLFNILLNPASGIAIRLSDWNKAFNTAAEITETPEPQGVDDVDAMLPFGMRPWYSQIAAPASQRIFRQHLANPPSATPGLDEASIAAAAAGELNYDADAKPFELDLRIGNTAAFVDEVLTTVRLMLQMLLTPLTDAVPAARGGLYNGESTGLVQALYGEGADPTILFDRHVPVFGLPSSGRATDPFVDGITSGWTADIMRHRIRVSRTVVADAAPTRRHPERIFETLDGRMSVSACAQFLYRHAALRATAPLSHSGGPSHRELSVLIASLNPFPITSTLSRGILDSTVAAMHGFACSEFKKGLYLVAVNHDHGDAYARGAYNNVHPVEPKTKVIHFTRTRSWKDGRFEWCSGSETTPTLEAAVGVIHLINAIVAASSSVVGTARVHGIFENDTGDDDGGPPPVNTHVSDLMAKRAALQHPRGSRRIGNSGTFVATGDTGVEYNASGYASWLGLTKGVHHNQAGYARFSGTPDGEGGGIVGCFEVVRQDVIQPFLVAPAPAVQATAGPVDQLYGYNAGFTAPPADTDGSTTSEESESDDEMPPLETPEESAAGAAAEESLPLAPPGPDEDTPAEAANSDEVLEVLQNALDDLPDPEPEPEPVGDEEGNGVAVDDGPDDGPEDDPDPDGDTGPFNPEAPPVARQLNPWPTSGTTTYNDAFQHQLHGMCEEAAPSPGRAAGRFDPITVNFVVSATAPRDSFFEINQLARYPRRQRIAIPAWRRIDSDPDVTHELIGYAVFSRFAAVVRRTADGRLTIVVDMTGQETVLSHMVVLHDDALEEQRDENTPEGAETYALLFNTYIGFSVRDTDVAPPRLRELLMVPRGVPVLGVSADGADVLRDTALASEAASATGGTPEVPFKFLKTERPIQVNTDSIARLLKSGFQGLHFSNSRALQHTVFAVAVGETRSKISRWMSQYDGRYPGLRIPWTESGNTGNAIMLEMLHSEHEKSGRRTLQAPLAERVTVQVKGPAPTALATECFVQGYYYRTHAFLKVEEDLIGDIKNKVASIIEKPRCMASSPIVNLVASETRNGRLTLYLILKAKPNAARLVAQLMILTHALQQVGLNTARARDKASLGKARADRINGINQLLFRT